MFKRIFVRALRVIAAQAIAAGPELLNFLAGTSLPAIPPPWNILVGGLLNGLGKGLRDLGAPVKPGETQKWTWVPL